MRPSIALNPYLRKHRHVTPWPLHLAAYECDVERLKAYIDYLRQQGAEVLDRELHACESSRHYYGLPFESVLFTHNYEVASLLLEAGTRPSNTDISNYTLFHRTVGRCSSLFRLLLWYDPDYENIKAVNSPEYRCNEYPMSWFVGCWDEESRRERGGWSVKEVIEKTARDSREVRSLFAKADSLIASGDLFAAIDCYVKASDIYKEHRYIQTQHPYFGPDDLIAYYHKKSQYCELKAYELYQKLFDEFQSSSEPVDYRQYRIVLAKLISIATGLDRADEAGNYALQFKSLFPDESAATVLMSLAKISTDDPIATVSEARGSLPLLSAHCHSGNLPLGEPYPIS